MSPRIILALIVSSLLLAGCHDLGNLILHHSFDVILDKENGTESPAEPEPEPKLDSKP